MVRWALSAIALLGVAVRVVVATPPAAIYLGGIFAPFLTSGEIDKSQLQHLSAFKLAIDDINNRSDILPNTQVSYYIREGNSFLNAAWASIKLSKLDVTAAVTALPDRETAGVHQVFTDSQTVVAHSLGMDSSFGNGLEYPYKVQTIPIDSFDGMVFQHILCHYFNFTRVIVFASDDDFGSKSAVELHDKTYCELEEIATFLIPPNLEDFTFYIERALKTDATIFVLFLDTSDTARLLEQGYEEGLFTMGTQILSSSSLLNANFLSYMTDSAHILEIMRGIIVIDYWPNYHVLNGGDNSSFVTSWRSQPDSSLTCSQTVDASGYHYLFPEGNTSESCTGLNFASVSTNGSDIDPYVALTYDATQLMLRGLHSLFESGASSVDGDALMVQLTHNVTFTGATGLIEIHEGDPSLNYYGLGDREVGNYFKMLNFDSEAYALNNDTGDVRTMFVAKRVWSLEAGVESCAICSTSDFQYRTADNSMPSCFPPYAHDRPPDIIKIGALFAPIGVNDTIDKVQVENLAAFILAIEHINNKTDGIADDILPMSKVKFAIRHASSFSSAVLSSEELLGAFYKTGVRGVVGSLPNDETMAANQLFDDVDVVQVHSMAQDAELGIGTKFPYRLQTCPIDSFQAVALQSIICSYGYKKISIFATDDEFGSKSAMEVQDDQYCEIDVLSQNIFRSDIEDYTEEINEAKLVGALINVFFMPAKNAAALLEQGYAKGIFHEDTQIFMSSQSAQSIHQYFSVGADIPALLKGVIVVEYWPSYSLSRTDEGKAFMKAWINQPRTDFALHGKRKVCNLALDDAKETFLYVEQTNRSRCIGLNFASYSSNGSDINPYAALTYDATMLLLRAIDPSVKAGKISIRGNDVIDVALNDSFSFHGASGLVSLYEGRAGFSYYGRGNRETGHAYRVKNFNKLEYANDKDSSFVQVMTWTHEKGLFPCDDQTPCYQVTYNTKDNQPARDTPPDIIVVLGLGGRGFLIALSIIVLLVVTGLSGMLFRFRSSKLIKASQPVMLYFILAGEVLAAIRVFIAGLPITDGTCTAGLWFGHLSFVFVFGALFIKTWRVNRIVNNSSLRRIKITSENVRDIMLVTILVSCVYMAILTGVGRPHKSAISTTISNQTTKEIRCNLDVSFLQTILFALEAVVLLAGGRLCWAVKDVPDAVNESKFIASAMTIIVMMCSLVFPIVFLISLSPPTQQVIASTSFGVAAISSSLIIFGPKFIILLRGDDVDNQLGVSKASGPTFKGDAKIDPKSNAESDTVVASTVALHGKTIDEKVRFCHEQTEKWRALLMQLNDKSSGSGTGSGTGSVAPVSRASSYVVEQESVAEVAMTTTSIAAMETMPQHDEIV